MASVKYRPSLRLIFNSHAFSPRRKKFFRRQLRNYYYCGDLIISWPVRTRAVWTHCCGKLRVTSKIQHPQQNGDANNAPPERPRCCVHLFPRLIHGVALRSQHGRSTRAMGKHPMPNRNRLLHYLGGETETSAWPVIRDQAGLSCVAEAAVLDDSRLIV